MFVLLTCLLLFLVSKGSRVLEKKRVKHRCQKLCSATLIRSVLFAKRHCVNQSENNNFVRHFEGKKCSPSSPTQSKFLTKYVIFYRFRLRLSQPWRTCFKIQGHFFDPHNSLKRAVGLIQYTKQFMLSAFWKFSQ